MQQDRVVQLQRGLRIEAASNAWMLIEMAVSIGTGIAAGSVLLIAFGVDSLIELLSGGILWWRLAVEARSGDVERVDRAEHRAASVVAVSLALLCAYVLISSVYGLVTGSKPEASAAGILVSAAALLIMPYLAVAKRRVATRIGSEALAADAVNAITCAYMAGTVLAGLGLNALFGWWWAEYLAALLFLFWLVRETLEAFDEAGMLPENKRGKTDEH